MRIVFRNLLPTGSDGDLFLPTDSSMMGSGMGPMTMPDPVNSSSVTDEVRNPACSRIPQAGRLLRGQPGDAAPARRHHPVDQRRHAAPVDHPGERVDGVAAGRQCAERAGHGRRGLRGRQRRLLRPSTTPTSSPPG